MRLWVRADASPAVGLGHVMRTLAVAERADELGVEVLHVASHDLAVRTLEGHRRRIVPTEAWHDRIAPGDVVLFDGYDYGPADEAAVRRSGARVGAVDDRGTGRHDVDVLLDQNPHQRWGYDVPARARLLLGPRHALVRREFLLHRRPRGGRTDTLLLTFGGSDPTGLTRRVLAALDGDRPFPRIVVVLGPGARTDVTARPGVEIVRAPPAPAPVFDRADAVLSAAGSTTWELLAMGLPVAVTAAVGNQVPVQRGVTASGHALGFSLEADPNSVGQVVAALADEQMQRRLSRRALALVDGHGADRLLAALIG